MVVSLLCLYRKHSTAGCERRAGLPQRSLADTRVNLCDNGGKACLFGVCLVKKCPQSQMKVRLKNINQFFTCWYGEIFHYPWVKFTIYIIWIWKSREVFIPHTSSWTAKVSSRDNQILHFLRWCMYVFHAVSRKRIAIIGTIRKIQRC